MSATRPRRIAALGLVLASIGAAALPAAGAAATSQKPIKVSHAYTVANGDVVQARATVRNAQPSVKSWWSRKTIGKVVRKGVNNGYEMPYWAQGYYCVPTVDDNNVAHFTCKLRGADVPTTITLRFTADYGG
jgi:hypothetical protein